MFLYLPIIVLVLYSFNSGAREYTWSHGTLKWYRQLFNSMDFWDAFQNSIIVAVSAVTLTLLMSSALVFFGNRTILRRFLVTFYANLIIPEIVFAVGLLAFFYFFSIPLSITTLIIGHTMIGLGYAVPMIEDRFNELDSRLIEASYDLGATPAQTFFKIILPLMSSTIVAAGMLVFIISFDDFVLSFFCSSGSVQTLPIYIFSMIRSGASPQISALSTLLLSVSALLVFVFSWLQRGTRKGGH
jgi:spermidine/putrescine transport system permease protein